MNARRYSGGLLVYIRISLVQSLSDHIIALHCKANYFRATKDIFILLVYIPPEDTTYICNWNNDYFCLLEQTVSRYADRGTVVVCGDMNARVGNLSDQPDHEVVPGDCNTAGPYVPTRGQENMQIPKRLSKDSKVNKYGRALIDLCKAGDLTIGNGRLYLNDHYVICETFCLGWITVLPPL